MPNIRTDYWPKPIPQRCFDYSAWYDGDEPSDGGGQRIGYGSTLMEAVDDLLTEYPPACVDCDGKGGILPGITCATCEGTGERCADDKLDPISLLPKDGMR